MPADARSGLCGRRGSSGGRPVLPRARCPVGRAPCSALRNRWVLKVEEGLLRAGRHQKAPRGDGGGSSADRGGGGSVSAVRMKRKAERKVGKHRCRGRAGVDGENTCIKS